jgi:hypothetical protein
LLIASLRNWFISKKESHIEAIWPQIQALATSDVALDIGEKDGLWVCDMLPEGFWDVSGKQTHELASRTRSLRGEVRGLSSERLEVREWLLSLQQPSEEKAALANRDIANARRHLDLLERYREIVPASSAERILKPGASRCLGL